MTAESHQYIMRRQSACFFILVNTSLPTDFCWL